MIDVKEIKRNISPVEVIEFYTGEKRTHNKYLCPFHDDKHPSLTVKADKWKCWACGENGDVINFVQKYFGIDFKDACKKLSEDFNLVVEVPESSKCDIWSKIKAECDKEQLEELDAVKAEINDKIEKLTTAHRVLYRLGHNEEASKYGKILDDLQEADIYTA